MASKWSEERRAKAAEAIRRWRPWEQSTGPRTPQGKAKASRNRDQGGLRPKLRELARVLRQQRIQQVQIADDLAQSTGGADWPATCERMER